MAYEDFYRQVDRRRVRLPRGLTASLQETRHLAATPGGGVLVGAVVALLVATLVGLAALWPRGLDDAGPSAARGGPAVAAAVTEVRLAQCPGPAEQSCRSVTVNVDGRTATIDLGPAAVSAELQPGDRIRVAPTGGGTYAFVDVDRGRPLLLLAVVLAAVSLLALRWRGLLAVAGVGLSVALLLAFVIPAILAGRPALLVALVGSLAVMFVTVVLTHGVGVQSLAAALGVAMTLVLTCGLALAAAGLAGLDGRSNELAQVLATQERTLSLEGVVLAGMLIGALGVLADTAVTQASAVMALRRTDPSLGARGLYRRAVVVGQDHLSATIHTLVLAYAGAVLPLLLVLRSAGVTLADGLSTQDVAEPIVATVVGCLALIAAVPLTTALAAALVARVPVHAVPRGHVHHH